SVRRRPHTPASTGHIALAAHRPSFRRRRSRLSGRRPRRDQGLRRLHRRRTESSPRLRSAIAQGSDGSASVTVTVTLALAESPTLSRAVTVITCVPRLSVERAKVAPVPMPPSRFELHTRLLLTSPSNASDAVPVNEAAAPKARIVPSPGASSVTTG